MSIVEGQTEFTQTYVQSVETDIILDRKFTIPGYTYNLTLVSFNMHDVTAPNIIMRWRILCANPVVPTDWQLDYNKSIHYGDTFEVPTVLIPIFKVSDQPGETASKEGCAVANEAKNPGLCRGWDARHQEHCHEEVL